MPSAWQKVSAAEIRAIGAKIERSNSDLDNLPPHKCVILDPGDAKIGLQPRIQVRGKERYVCPRSLFLFPITGIFRQIVLAVVEWKWFERFILLLIALNSVFLAGYSYRESPDTGFNYFVNEVAEIVFLVFFSLEMIMKIIAWGFFLDKRSYLRDGWNWLDFVVVVSAIVQLTGLGGGLSFLRLFRILRPLRSLNAVPQMKVLVNTVISSVPRLGYVSGIAGALFMIFGIIGTTVMDGMMYRGCRVTLDPVLINVTGASTQCWSWPYVQLCDGDECESDRLCGGNYMCEDSSGFCGGREDDQNYRMRPVFPGLASVAPGVDTQLPYDQGCAPGLPEGEPCTYRGGYPWCEDSIPRKQYPETDFIHFDHMGGALLTLFQCMTMEGWVDIMYYAQDAYGYWVGAAYFFLFNAFASIFLLNIALAVVDEAREDFEEDEPEEEEKEENEGEEKPGSEHLLSNLAVAGDEAASDDEDDDGELFDDLWLNRPWVVWLRIFSQNQIFQNTIMFFISGNVVVMALDQYPPAVELDGFVAVSEYVFLCVFIIEMCIMIGAHGPKGYVMNPVTCFDGAIVTISIVQELVPGSAGGGFAALRTLRLLRVMNKLANRWPSFRVLLKAMAQTGISLNYWLVLFLLVLYICTLMWMEFFSKQFHFVDVEAFDAPDASIGSSWCEGIVGSFADLSVAQRKHAESCIPRAHFDTFQWSFITIFQIMTGENWNTVMYAGLRSKWNERGSFYLFPELMASLFVLLILFGQILFLSLFLSMLISKFDTVQDELEEIEFEKERLKKLQRENFERRKSRSGLGSPAHKRAWSLVHSVSNRMKSVSSANLGGDSGGGSGADLGRLDGVVPAPDPEVSERRVVKPRKDPVLDESARLPGQIEEDGLEDAAPPNTGGETETIRFGQTTLVTDRSEKKVADQEGRQLEEDEQIVEIEELNAQPPGNGAASSGAPLPGLVVPKRPAQVAPAELEVEELPDSPCSPASPKLQDLGASAESLETLQSHESDGPGKWPKDYALLVLSKANPLRLACRWVLEKQVQIGESKINIFDNFILLCICINSICMMIDSPLRHQNAHGDKAFFVMADQVFATIFIVEMLLKLCALGLWFGPKCYLRSGWNWLDFVVVIVSIIDMASPGSSKVLKTLRIMRAFRPLRIVSRNKNLRMVVSTMFGAMPDLLTLIVVSMLFLLIFALFALQYLRGKFYHCAVGAAPVSLLDDMCVGNELSCVTPLCLPGNGSLSACPHGAAVVSSVDFSAQWVNASTSCSSAASRNQLCSEAQIHPWQRATADTPICVGRCNPEAQAENPTFWEGREWLCQPALTSAAELPSVCPNKEAAVYLGGFSQAEQDSMSRGQAWVEKMQRSVVMPCGGSTVVSGNLTTPDEAAAVSCRQMFCGHRSSIPQERRESCSAKCKRPQYFCYESCDSAETGDLDSANCRSCRQECEAACECEEFCEPLIKDAAVCSEQGGQWAQRLSQNFDNVGSAFLTLFEIMSTEGWVDVMYAAVDSTDAYREPIRDNTMPFAWFFVIYMMLSFMFLLNLSVGVITDRYMDLKAAAAETQLTDEQKRWIKGNLNLLGRGLLYNQTDLHLLPYWQERAYRFISSRGSENFIMSCIILNTIFMSLRIFPEGLNYQEDFQNVNLALSSVFFLEFGLKLYAYRSNYWKDVWNRFDFFCVVAAFVGIIVKLAGFRLGHITGILRSFRIARLFRFSVGLNKIFTALILSIPKLSNVFLVFILFLVLFSILGVNLFAPMKLSETFNIHANFRSFPQAFITLYRSSTGEAWNEIMHDLGKSPEDYFRAGDWCTPSDLWDTGDWETYQRLDARCLIDNPNSCPTYAWFPVAYYVMYTLLISYMVMNLLVAVILDGYEDGKPTPESDMIDLSIGLWRKYDPNQTMYAEIDTTMGFIHEVVKRSEARKVSKDSPDSAQLSPGEWLKPVAIDTKLKYMKAFKSMNIQDGRVHFPVAVQQCLRLICAGPDAQDFVDNEEDIHVEQDMPDDIKRQLKKLKTLEIKKSRIFCEGPPMVSVQHYYAAVKLQRFVRERVIERMSRGRGPDSPALSAAGPLREAIHPADAGAGGGAGGEGRSRHTSVS